MCEYTISVGYSSAGHHHHEEYVMTNEDDESDYGAGYLPAPEDVEDADEDQAEDGISVKDMLRQAKDTQPDDMPTSVLQAVRRHCVSTCMCGSVNEVKLCTADGVRSKPRCMLFPFRFGKNPFRQVRVLTEEQRRVAAERLKNARNKKGNS